MTDAGRNENPSGFSSRGGGDALGTGSELLPRRSGAGVWGWGVCTAFQRTHHDTLHCLLQAPSQG